MRMIMAAAACGMLASAAAAAPSDRHAASAIQAGDLVKAETILIAERDGRWTTPETLLNLAHVYRQTGRADAARGLYEQVLSGRNVLLTAGDARPLWSHDIARAALAKVQAGTTIAAR